MARIRSIHPGIFTDEAFMTASPHGRLLIMGLWCEAFDDGCVELKPVTLKARIFPVDNVDVVALLDELESLRVFKRFTIGGKDWGAIRNFRRFQRPKKPNQSPVLTAEMADYVGMLRSDKQHPAHAAPPTEGDDLFPENEDSLSEFPQIDPSTPPSSELASRMEDGGDKMEEKKGEKTPSTAASVPPREAEPSRADDLRSFERDCRGLFPEKDQPKGSFAPLALLVERGAKLEEALVVLRAEAAKHRGTPIASWPGWAKVVGDRLAASPSGAPSRAIGPPPRFIGRKVNTPRAGALAEDFLRGEHSAGRWRAAYGPEPGHPGCVLPN